MKPIYRPKGKAAEYAEYALNIYTGCSNGCEYCYAPAVLRKNKDDFRFEVEPRAGIVEATKKQLASGVYKGKTIHLCFTCDPYPFGKDTTATTEIIRAIKDAGAHVQILTKRPSIACEAGGDLCLLDEGDMFGVTITGASRKVEWYSDDLAAILSALKIAHSKGIGTWISFEPVYNPGLVLLAIKKLDFVDLFKIGKLNYHPSDINWALFGRAAEAACRKYRRNYLIKESLRGEMNCECSVSLSLSDFRDLEEWAVKAKDKRLEKHYIRPVSVFGDPDPTRPAVTISKYQNDPDWIVDFAGIFDSKGIEAVRCPDIDSALMAASKLDEQIAVSWMIRSGV